jgi:acetate kinase
MKQDAFLYGLPYSDYEEYGIRKYGFHGTSHKFVAREAAKILNKPLNKLKLVTCHIGNGASICAVKYGESVDTSMGMTPLAGLVMGSRSGDIDPSVVATLCQVHDFTVYETVNYLNKKCGLKGLFGKGEGDMRDIEVEFQSNPRAKIAVGVFVHSLVKYIGAYIAEMGGADAVVWTGGIGIHRPWIADMTMAHFDFLPNLKRLVIPTNEELEIATECEQILRRK